MTVNNDLPKNNEELLREILDVFTSRNPNVLSALVVSDDGLSVASGIPHKDDDDVSVITSDLVDTARDFSQRLEQGGLNRILLEGERRTTVVMSAGTRTVLVVSLPANEKLGLIALSMRQAADQIASIFG